jgi:carboxylate-amine ligase
MTAVLPVWAAWNPLARERPFSIGVEEEVMLIDAASGDLAWRVADVLAAADADLLAHLAPETHGCVVELHTDPQDDTDAALAELARLRAALRTTLAPLGLRPAAAGTHPFARCQDAHVPAGSRQQQLQRSLRGLARREPTFALHVHVAVGDPDIAVRAMNRMRAHVPLLLALSANSPFWRGRDSGLASVRTPLFQAFPRAGLPRVFADYEDLVGAQDTLVRSGAIPEPSYIWWDVRLQPRYGTLEVRVMDVQTTLGRTRALVALTRALVAAEATEEGLASPTLVGSYEALNENRFLASRDGVDAELIDPERGALVPVSEVLEGLDVGGFADLLEDAGPAAQRRVAQEPRGLVGLVEELAARY